MLVTIDQLLNQQQLNSVARLLTSSSFVDGKLTAGYSAKAVKNNLELNAQDSVNDQLNNIVMNALVRHPTFKHAAWPKKIAAPFYAKYEKGMAYGTHVDDPVMGHDGELYRSDISVTVFLSRPEDYEGGELTLLNQYGEHQYGEQAIKLNAGCAVIYPSSSKHFVAPVTKGTRYVAVTWVQSAIRDPAQREILFELNNVRNAVLKDQLTDTSKQELTASFNNLVRMWADI